MRNRICTALAALLSIPFAVGTSIAQSVDYLPNKTLDQLCKASLQPMQADAKYPIITWGGDLATVHGELSGIFDKQLGGKVQFVCENDFAKQAQLHIDGKIKALRGTMGMISAAAPVFAAAGSPLVVVYQSTWSTGGDCIVARSHIKTPKDLEGRTIGLQRHGPHVNYVATLLSNAGVDLSQVKFKWLKELTIPDPAAAKTNDPVTAFGEDSSLDAIMCIIPDAEALTSGGKVGTGAEGSVKGAHILATTATNDRVIADVYAVHKKHFDGHRDEVKKFVKGLFLAQESWGKLVANKSAEQAKYKQVIAKGAEYMFGGAELTDLAEPMIGDCSFVGYAGNIAFFQGIGTTRNLTNMSKQIQDSFANIGIISKKAQVDNANWDYASMKAGLTNTVAAAAKPRFDKKRAQAKVEQMMEAEPSTWAEVNTLFVREILFKPNQNSFPTATYATMYQEIIELAQTNSGALIVIEGHADPLGILKAERKGMGAVQLNLKRQKAKNLSLQRAEAVKKAFLAFCKAQNMQIDESQFVVSGIGARMPKFSPPRTEKQWNANRRVVFRVKNIEAEASVFTPLDK